MLGAEVLLLVEVRVARLGPHIIGRCEIVFPRIGFNNFLSAILN